MSEFWRDRAVLVTGATGLLGSWMVDGLLARGAWVVALVRDIVPDALFLTGGGAAGCVLVLGDVEDGRLVERVLAEHEIDAVFHLAAQTIVEHAHRDPVGTFRSNVAGTWEVLDACRRSGRPTRVLVASSDKAYGDQAALPYHEGHPLQGRHPYDVSKSCADLIAHAYGVSYDLPVVITRCGNLFGGGDLNFNRIVPGTIRDALAGRRPVLRSDGRPVRDYLYVEDAVEAYVALAERAHEPPIVGQAWNFSNQVRLTAEQMCRRVLGACGRPDIEPEVPGTASGEIVNQYLSSAKARDVVGLGAGARAGRRAGAHGRVVPRAPWPCGVAGRLGHQAAVAASVTAGWTSGDGSGSGTGSSGVATHAGRSVGSASATAGCDRALVTLVRIAVCHAWPPRVAIITGVPRRTRLRSRERAPGETRRHPADAACPIELGAFVPWMASWSPPPQPGGRFGWCPDRPKAYQPNGPAGLPVSTRSVTLNEPVGVGVPDAPIAAGNRATWCRPRITTTWRLVRLPITQVRVRTT
ncbi:MAG TPA: NAD-dependent epimerase/dehydratase family protein [Gaiellales bacterium]|nr:NAD-dependent epimerase/dehydratase family protein [Gaiellales bacterium]